MKAALAEGVEFARFESRNVFHKVFLSGEATGAWSQGQVPDHAIVYTQGVMNTPQIAYILVVAVIIAAVLLTLGLFLGLRLGRRSGRLEAERGLPDRLASERGDAVRRSRAVLGGLAAEQLAPWLPGFPFDPTEVRFIGKPVDFVAFVGSSGGRIEEVAFVEVKTGNASLSPVERSLRDAVKAGRVSWVEYRVP